MYFHVTAGKDQHFFLTMKSDGNKKSTDDNKMRLKKSLSESQCHIQELTSLKKGTTHPQMIKVS